jgi:uncharacterized protein (TIGR02145 family)
MPKTTFLFVLMFGWMISYGQNISITFTGKGAATSIDSVTATNLATSQSATLPGNETLILNVFTGVPSISELPAMGTVFPNPFPGKATFKTIVQQPQTVCLKVQNLLGQVVAQTSAFVQPGENSFALSLNTDGIYFVSLSAGQIISGYKVICTETTSPANYIQYLGSRSNNPNNLPPSELKSSQTAYTLGYTLGDIIQYECISGDYTTILTNSPVSSGSYEVELIPCTDKDGRNYSIITIGSQTWMAENLAYLPSVGPPLTGSESSPYYYVYNYYGNDLSAAKATGNYSTYGVLYNWEAAKIVCPAGWHLPSNGEWTILVDSSGGWETAGGKMKETGTLHWISPNKGAANSTGFTGLPAGQRDHSGGFNLIGKYGLFWSSKDETWTGPLAVFRDLNYNRIYVNQDTYDRSGGFSVRCLKD